MKNLLYQSLGLYLNLITYISAKKSGQLGFAWFCKPQRSKLKTYQLDFLRTAEQEDFSFYGINIKVYKWGCGPKKVLFVHGWQSHSFRWKRYIESLPQHEYTMYAFDAPGHGLSGGNQFTVPLNAYLIALLSKKYQGFESVVAHSIGSMSLLYALAHYPIKDIRRIVALATPGKAEDFFSFYVKMLGLNPVTVESIKNQFHLYVKQELNELHSAKFAEKINLPGLIIHDKKDFEAPFRYAEELQQSWKNASLISTEGLGHNLKSKAIVALVSDFIRYNALDKKRITPLNAQLFELKEL